MSFEASFASKSLFHCASISFNAFTSASLFEVAVVSVHPVSTTAVNTTTNQRAIEIPSRTKVYTRGQASARAWLQPRNGAVGAKEFVWQRWPLPAVAVQLSR